MRVAVTSIPRFAREVYFSPNGGRTDAIVRELDKAQSTVLVQGYSSSSYKIAKALLDVHKRGIKVEIFFHKNQKRDQYSSADFLANSGMSVKIDSEHAIAHNKAMIIDGGIIITGSFNFTKAREEKDAEKLLVIYDRKLAEQYTKNWEEHTRHSEVYVGRRRFSRSFYGLQPEVSLLRQNTLGLSAPP